MADQIQFPTVSARRGGIQYPRPGTPEWAAAETRQAELQAAYAAHQASLTATVTGKVWLAWKDNGWDGSELLEVCATEERARAICQHRATAPRTGDLTPAGITWGDEGGETDRGDRYVVNSRDVTDG